MARLARHSMQIWLPFETYNILNEDRKSLGCSCDASSPICVLHGTPDGQRECRGACNRTPESAILLLCCNNAFGAVLTNTCHDPPQSKLQHTRQSDALQCDSLPAQMGLPPSYTTVLGVLLLLYRLSESRICCSMTTGCAAPGTMSYRSCCCLI